MGILPEMFFGNGGFFDRAISAADTCGFWAAWARL
jgi:hypothetical protein